MKKKEYQQAKLEIFCLSEEDVITASVPPLDSTITDDVFGDDIY